MKSISGSSSNILAVFAKAYSAQDPVFPADQNATLFPIWAFDSSSPAATTIPEPSPPAIVGYTLPDGKSPLITILSAGFIGAASTFIKT